MKRNEVNSKPLQVVVSSKRLVRIQLDLLLVVHGLRSLLVVKRRTSLNSAKPNTIKLLRQP